MPLKIETIFANVYDNGTPQWITDAWLRVTGATAGNRLISYVKTNAGSRNNSGGTYATAGTYGTCLVPVENPAYSNGVNGATYSSATGGFVVVDAVTAEAVTVGGPWYPINNIAAGTWTVTQDSSKNVLVTCTSFGATSACPVFTNFDGSVNTSVVEITQPPQIWQISLLANSGSVLETQMVRPFLNGQLPSALFSSTLVTVTSEYFVRVRHKPTGEDVVSIISSVLTAPVTSGGGGGGTTAMFSWLNNDYWWLTDLQVNLGTRAVTHRHGTLELRPNDTVNFAVLFHDGSAGKDPVATDLRLAVRSASNASAYYFWANPSVTTTSVSGDIYYTITVTASDEDLLSAQAAGLLSGSNNSQTLLAEVQWTTTRGTFTSDTFTIEVPSEIIREPDV